MCVESFTYKFIIELHLPLWASGQESLSTMLRMGVNIVGALQHHPLPLLVLHHHPLSPLVLVETLKSTHYNLKSKVTITSVIFFHIIIAIIFKSLLCIGYKCSL